MEEPIKEICNVADALDIEKYYISQIKNETDYSTFFRGENNILTNNKERTESTASLFREDVTNYKNESNYIENIISGKDSRSFETLPDYMSKIAKIQHYGGRTRLLDFSECFWIALFFACYSSDDNTKNSDGLIYHFKTDCLDFTTSDKDNYRKKILEDYIRYSGNTFTEFNEWIKVEENQYQKTAEEIQQLISKHHFIKIIPSSVRMKNQKGLFLWMGETKFSDNPILLDGIKSKPSGITIHYGRGQNYQGKVGYVKVKSSVKKDILNYLQKEHGIDEEFIFAEEGFDKNLEDYIRSFKI
ncbi:FRG domain-containing protein [Treponema bryantii]|uniref:FRG domain-containing protein n=1 Tax=Treponema bryantii TaxID=163 RepID=A0A1I3HW83_9SPIR|nr:FRG domain-containing protein [Treponema bryantii]SFI40018.1 FRG domain-containing protein [Treponema bryantii]